MSQLVLTRVAHASVLLDFDGTVVLTDPWFSEKAGYYHGEPYGVSLADLPKLAGVVASHAHYDHFDISAFASYPHKSVPFAVKTPSMAADARTAGFTNVTPLEPWQSVDLGGVRVTATPAAHGVPENSYVLQKDGLTVFFGADTLLIPELAAIRDRFDPIDLALLPVNGLQIRPLLNRQVVMNAREAAELCRILHPRVAVPIHYAFTAGRLRDMFLLRYTGTAEQFEHFAAQLAPETTVRILAPSEPLRLTSRVVRRSCTVGWFDPHLDSPGSYPGIRDAEVAPVHPRQTTRSDAGSQAHLGQLNAQYAPGTSREVRR